MKQKDQNEICRYREYLLQDESGKESGKGGVIPFAAGPLVKGMIKGLRYKKREIKMLFQKQKEGWDIIRKHVIEV